MLALPALILALPQVTIGQNTNYHYSRVPISRTVGFSRFPTIRTKPNFPSLSQTI